MESPQTHIRVIVVDDEPPARRKLVHWLSQDDEITVLAECSNGFEALDTLHDWVDEIDVIFLDVQMPQMDAFEMLAQVPASRRPMIVFVTAYDQYAVDAFKYHAIDYLLKPYDRDRFAGMLGHVKKQFRQASIQTLQTRLTSLLDTIEKPRNFLSHFTLKHKDHVQLVKVESVDWIAAEGNYVKLHLHKGKSHLVRNSIGKLAEQLNPEQFPRIHRSTIVNLDKVKRFYPASHGDYQVLMNDGTELFMSRSFKNQMRKSLQVGL